MIFNYPSYKERISNDLQTKKLHGPCVVQEYLLTVYLLIFFLFSFLDSCKTYEE